MEFDDTTTPSTGATDTERLLASSKKVTLAPLNPFVQPDKAEIVIGNEVAANIDRDSEDTGKSDSLVRPSTSEAIPAPATKPPHAHHSLPLLIAGLVCLAACVAAALYLPHP